MRDTEGYCVILTTCGDREQAGGIASGLVRNRLAACVQIMPITSYYEWKKEVNTDAEQLLIIKAKQEAYQRIEEYIINNHTYEIPEVIKIPIQGGFASYLRWIDEVST